MAGKIVLYAPHGTIDDEKKASGVITPGDILQKTPADLVIRHAVAGGNVHPLMVAVDMPMLNRGVDDNYADGEQCPHVFPRSGEILHLNLNAGESVTRGQKLESAGNGKVQAHIPTYLVEGMSDAIVGMAEETIDNGAGATPVRIRVSAA